MDRPWTRGQLHSQPGCLTAKQQHKIQSHPCGHNKSNTKVHFWKGRLALEGECGRLPRVSGSNGCHQQRVERIVKQLSHDKADLFFLFWLCSESTMLAVVSILVACILCQAAAGKVDSIHGGIHVHTAKKVEKIGFKKKDSLTISYCFKL